jgi:hypothetical protein
MYKETESKMLDRIDELKEALRQIRNLSYVDIPQGNAVTRAKFFGDQIKKAHDIANNALVPL